LSVGILDSLQLCNKQLEQIFKSLETYLESKRAAFPRFYFISNEELLDVLSQTRNPEAITPHLPKCFSSAHNLVFEDASPASATVEGVQSAEGEVLMLNGHVKSRGSVEIWLKQLEECIQRTLKTKARVALVDYHSTPFEQWFERYPSQIILLISCAIWTERVEKALKRVGNATILGLQKRFVVRLKSCIAACLSFFVVGPRF
jgi:dynein heavy chain